MQNILDPKTFHSAGWFKCVDRCQSGDQKWDWVAGIDKKWKIRISNKYKTIYKLDTRCVLYLGNITANSTELFRCDVRTSVANGSLDVESIAIELLLQAQMEEKLTCPEPINSTRIVTITCPECSTDHSHIMAALITVSVLFGVSIIIIVALVLKILSQKQTNNFVNENTSVKNSCNVDRNCREEHESSQGNVNEYVDRELSSLDYGLPEDNNDNNEGFVITSEL